MPKPTLSDVMGLADPMLNDNFELVFTKIPGGGDGRQLRLQCKTGVKPGTTISEVEYELFGHKSKHAARKVFSGSMSISFVETYEGRIVKTIEDWAETIRGTQSQHGTFKADYATTATLIIYDQTGAEAVSYTIYNVWPTEIPEYSFDGAGGAIVDATVNFSYDYYERN